VCHRPDVDRRYPGGLLWVTVGQEVHGADLAGKVNDLAFALTGTRPALSDPDAAGAELGRLLDEHDRPVLLVVDDVWEAVQLRPFRFGGRLCTRLVTTRIPQLLPADGVRITVDVMSAGQARDLVTSGVGGLPAGAADRLAVVAGCWPVLLSLVNGVLRRRVARGKPPDQAAVEMERLLTADGPAALDPARPGERTRAVAATVEASLTLLDEGDRRRYLDLAIFPEDVDVPLDVLALLWPGCRADGVCEEFAGLGLVADVRFDPPGPRLVVHDVLRAYLRARRGPDERAAVHRRLVDAAAGLLRRNGGDVRPWWRLPASAGYLWRFLPHHLHEAGRSAELAALVCDLRWVEAKTREIGSTVGVQADLALVDIPTAAALGRALRPAAHLLTPIDPPDALGATLASRLHGLPALDAVLARYRATLPRPRLEPAWPLPDQPDPTLSFAAVGHAGSVTSCAFSPDGTLLATTSDDCTARLWRVADGTQRAVMTGHTGGVWDCAFSPDGTVLATVGDDRAVRLWQVADGMPLAVLAGHTDWVQSCAFSPDGALLATASDDGTVRLWPVADRTTQPMVLQSHTGRATDCAFSPDGTLLATTSDDCIPARLWQVPDGIQLAALTGDNTGGMLGCAFSPDGTLLATTSGDGTVRLWRIPDGAPHMVLTGHTDRVNRCGFSPDGTVLATTSDDHTIRLWPVADDTLPAVVLEGHAAWVRGCAFSPDGTMLATTGNEQAARLWEVASATPHTSLTSHRNRVNAGAFSPDGTLLATTSSDGTVRLWREAGDGEPAILTGHTGSANRCAFSPDSTLLATTSTDRTVRLWRIPGGTDSSVLEGHTARTRGCAFSPDGTLLATASDDRTVRLWHMPDGTLTTVLSGHDGRVSDCAFSPDGTLLATAGNDGVWLWQAADGTPKTMVLTGHTDRMTSCAFSPDGTLLATASDDRTVRLWHMPDGTPEAVLTGHSSWVERCAFSPDGALLATASRDGTVRLWHVATRRCQCALRVAGPLIGVAWHPSGTRLCATGGAGTYMLSYLP
jgi:WD40 repeat protein